MPFFDKIKSKKSIADLAKTAGSQGLNRLATLAISMLIARNLGAEDFGLYTLFYGVFILIYQAQTGATISFVRFAKIQSAHEKKHIIRNSLLIQLIIASILIFAGWPFALLLSKILSLESPNVVFVGFVASGFLSLFRVWFGIFQEKGQFGRLGVCMFAFNLLILIILSSLWLLRKDVSISCVLSIYLGTSGTMGIASAIILWIKSSGSQTEEGLFPAMFRMTGMNMLVTFTYFLQHFVDIFFIKYFLDLQAVGIYSSGMKTSMIINLMTGALPIVLLPKAIEAIKSSNSLRRYILKSYSLCFYILVLFGGFFILSPYVHDILFGEKYISAIPLVKVLILGWAVNVLYIPVMQLFYAVNRVGLRLAVEVFKVGSSVLFFVLLIPSMGPVGAAWALLISISLSLILGSVIASYLMRKSPLQNMNIDMA